MSKMDDRGKAFENKFFHDEELQFKLHARRRKMLGLWAAEQMHLTEEKSLEYALNLVQESTVRGEEDPAVKIVADDLTNAGLSLTYEQVKDKSDTLQEKAMQMLAREFDLS